MNPKRAQLPKVDRPKQEYSAEMMEAWMRFIRYQLCQGISAKEWYQSQRIFMKAVTYIAGQLNKQGVSLPPERYRQIVMEVLMKIKLHCREVPKYWPGYVLSCFQKHWKHHGEEYYNEGKAIRAQVERAMLAFIKPKDQPEPKKDLVSTLAEVNAIVSRPKKRACKTVETAQQELF